MNQDQLIINALKKLGEATLLLRELAREHGLATQSEEQSIDVAFLDTLVADLDLGPQTRNRVLRLCSEFYGYEGHNPITTVRELVALEEMKMRRFPNFGTTTINRLKVILAAHGLRFGMKL